MTTTIHQGTTLLASGNAGVSLVLGGVEVNGETVVDVVERIRAAEIVSIARGNASNTVRFTIQSWHASHAAAIHARNMARGQRAAVADYIETLLLGATTHQWTLAGAGWKTTNAKCEGVSCTISYDVTGGLFTYVANPPEASVDTVADAPFGGSAFDILDDNT